MHFARLKNHDCRGEGYYFVTFATAPRRALLSEIRAGQIRLSPEQGGGGGVAAHSC